MMISDRELGEAASPHGSMRKRTETAMRFPADPGYDPSRMAGDAGG
ncbi:hypothetical protein [Agrobacterium tumefaciens]|nr:hypothetical protein [Agrobacterium tumefaciens]